MRKRNRKKTDEQLGMEAKQYLTDTAEPDPATVKRAVDIFSGEATNAKRPKSPIELCLEGVRFYKSIDRQIVIRRCEEELNRQLQSQADFLYSDIRRTEDHGTKKALRLEEALRTAHERHANDLIAWAGEGRRFDEPDAARDNTGPRVRR